MDFESFRQAVQDALIHLHDPDFQPHPLLYVATGSDLSGGPAAVQACILRAIESLKPEVGVPRSSRAWREYQTLMHRFVLGLSVEESAERLFLARRTLQRAQREAVLALSRQLWGARPMREPAPPAETPGVASDWRTQAQQELASLQMDARAPSTEVASVVRDVLEMGTLLTGRPEIVTQQGFVQPDLVAGVHPSALKQMLVTAVRRVAAHARGPITIYGGLEDGQARVTLTAVYDASRPPSEAALVGDILLPAGASTEVHLKEDTVFLSLRLPSPDALTVVVLDDNPDIVHFYRRCVAGSAYRITEAPSANDLFELVGRMPVHAIVLDIMLPDVDGWKLLMRLYEDPHTRTIPVVVCTVVREEELALSLGAAAYLAKPVSPQQFVATLDRVTGAAHTAKPKTGARSSGSG